MMFYFIFLLLCLVAAAFLLAPLWLHGRVDERGRQSLNIALFRERIAGLDEAGEESQALQLEARQDLLTDAAEVGRVRAETGRNEGWLIAAALFVPLIAGIIYMDFGLGRGDDAISGWWCHRIINSIPHLTFTVNRIY